MDAYFIRCSRFRFTSLDIGAKMAGGVDMGLRWLARPRIEPFSLTSFRGSSMETYCYC